MSEQKPAWVELLAGCEINTVFADLIKTVKQDAEAMSALPSEKRRYCKYACRDLTPGQATVFRTDESGHPFVPHEKPSPTDTVILVKDATNHRIQIHLNSTERPSYRDFALSWNIEKQICGLVLDGKADRPLEVWQVSQEVFVPLFFDIDSEEARPTEGQE